MDYLLHWWHYYGDIVLATLIVAILLCLPTFCRWVTREW